MEEETTDIHNGMDAPHFVPRDSARAAIFENIPELAKYSEDTWSVTISELHPVKNHDVVIESMRDVPKSNLRHIIIGGGEEYERLNALIKKYDLTHRIFLAGPIKNAATLLMAFDIFILPSRSEAFPYVLLEAAHAGLPVIASHVGGIPEIITNTKNGILIPANDSDRLADALRHILLDTAMRTRMGEKNLSKSMSFSADTMVDNTQKLYG